MKTLKKVLSVALVIAMAFSLVTMVGAAGTVAKYQDFTDADAIVNKEAVDTLVGLGVINGMDDGSYAPNGHFTRAQASKIIAYLLLGDNVAASLRASSAPFADVAATHWAAPFVQFCVTRGILNGVGDNKFDPEGSVTAAQFAKMLLTAAGYGKKGEYVGADWAINVIVDAQNLGILDTGVDYMAPATRDQVARYAFNFYTKVAFMNFDKNVEDYVASGKGTLAAQQGVAYVGTTKYVNGVASQQWGKNGKALTGNYYAIGNAKVLFSGVYDDNVVKPVTVSGMYTTLNLTLDASHKVLLNGANVTAMTGKTLLETAEIKAENGTDFAFVDEDSDGDVDVINLVQKSVLKVNNVTVTPNGKVTITGDYAAVASMISGADKDKVFGYADLKRGDVVLYYYDAAAQTHYLEKAKLVTGVVSKVTKASGNVAALTVADVVYKPYPAALRPSTFDLATSYALGETNYVYVDSNNLVVYVAPEPQAVEATSYGLVLTAKQTTDVFGAVSGCTIRLLKEDGTVGVYQQAGITFMSDTTAPVLVAYSFTDDGKVNVTAKTTSDVTVSTAYTKGDRYIAASSTNYYLTTATKVFYYGATTYAANVKYAVVTGYANVQNIAATTTVKVYGAVAGVVDVLLVNAEPASVSTAKYGFTPAALDWSGEVKINNVLYKQATAYANGKAITLTATEAVVDGLTSGTGAFAYEVDGNGYLTSISFTPSTTLVNPASASRVSHKMDGYLVHGTDLVLFTSENTEYFLYDATTGTITEMPISASVPSVIDYKIVAAIRDQNAVATEVYYTITVL